ncbi:MAG: Hsp20/alpha crystallin family protein [Oligoflexia bacterium]|nr:Hsp20/alpha crystallin family protein [Oligoflexia bacterium]
MELTNWPTSETHANLAVLPIDVEETDKEYILHVNAPGMEKENMEITLEDKVLTVTFKETKTAEKKEKNYLLKERFEGAASRAIELPLANTQGSADATHTNGVLTIKVAKAQSSVATKVTIK